MYLFIQAIIQSANYVAAEQWTVPCSYMSRASVQVHFKHQDVSVTLVMALMSIQDWLVGVFQKPVTVPTVCGNALLIREVRRERQDCTEQKGMLQ